MAEAVTAETFMGVERFDFLRPLADAWRILRDEYKAAQAMARPWPESYLHNGGWFTIPLIFNGARMPWADAAPRAYDLAQSVPGVFIAGFSILQPGAVIEPHVGYTDRVLRSHLGLRTNGHAFIEVGGERRHWRDGELFVFDDTASHHAANPGDTDRVIFLLDFDRGTL